MGHCRAVCPAHRYHTFVFLFYGLKFGIEETKDPSLYDNWFWKISFYTHIPFGALSLLIGWVQFSKWLRRKYLNVHRIIGKVYVVSFLLSSLAGVCIAFYATGGLVPGLGFMCVGSIGFLTTLKAYSDIKKGLVASHERMMALSFACCFSAVTFRIWQPLLSYYTGDFEIAYPIAAWMSWVPNLAVVAWMTRKI
jgi:uncharacterized membrane protein